MSIDTESRGPLNPAAVPQPMPTKGKCDVLPEVIKDLQDRDALGREKYGTTLQSHNGRKPLMDAYQELLDQVMYFKQELMERSDKRPVYNWPEVKFARSGSITDQLSHILSEVDEIIACGPVINTALLMEIADLHHSLETFWRKVIKQSDPDFVARIFQAVEDKNDIRGYYDIDADTLPCPSIAGPFGEMPYDGGGHAR